LPLLEFNLLDRRLKEPEVSALYPRETNEYIPNSSSQQKRIVSAFAAG